jgi:hypothetical protein
MHPFWEKLVTAIKQHQLHTPYFKYLSSHSNINLFISLVLIGSVGICPAIGKTINFDSVPMSWSALKYLYDWEIGTLSSPVLDKISVDVRTFSAYVMGDCFIQFSFMVLSLAENGDLPMPYSNLNIDPMSAWA